MSLHTWHCQDPCKPSSCTTFMLNSHWGNADTSKKKKNLEPMHAGSLWQCPALYDPVDCGLPGFSVREGVVLQARYWSVLANVLQYSCLENPPPWQATVYRVAKTRTRPKCPGHIDTSHFLPVAALPQ